MLLTYEEAITHPPPHHYRETERGKERERERERERKIDEEKGEVHTHAGEVLVPKSSTAYRVNEVDLLIFALCGRTFVHRFKDCVCVCVCVCVWRLSCWDRAVDSYGIRKPLINEGAENTS